MKVHELISKLMEYDPDSKVMVTWEGIKNPLDIYCVLIDADYKLRWQETKCIVCGEQATGILMVALYVINSRKLL